MISQARGSGEASEDAELEPRSGPDRMCLATRRVLPIEALIRFVRGPGGELVPDVGNRLPGRGVWVGADRESLALALKRKVFARGFKAEVSIPPDLAARTEIALRSAALDALALANKAGQAVSGFERILAMKARVAVLVQAEDGSNAEADRLAQRLAARGPSGEAPARFRCLAGRELGLSLGREDVIHVALAEHGIVELLCRRLARFASFRSVLPDGGGSGSIGDPESDGASDGSESPDEGAKGLGGVRI